MFFRIIVASFVKDAIIAAWIPSMHATVVKPKVGDRIKDWVLSCLDPKWYYTGRFWPNKVLIINNSTKNETFDDSWVPENDRNKPTLAKDIGNMVIFCSRKIVKWSQFLFLSGVGTCQALACLLVHLVSGIAYFGMRSFITTVFSILLLACNCVQVSFGSKNWCNFW